MARCSRGVALSVAGYVVLGLLGLAAIVAPDVKAITLGYVAAASLGFVGLSLSLRHARRAVETERLRSRAELRAQDARF